MDQKELREKEAKCVQENPPGCTAGCPVHVDVRGIVAAVRKGDYAAGFILFRKMVPFPGIISRICEQPCRKSCKRNELDEPILIHALERVCVDRNDKSLAKLALQPQKNKKVAIVGAGLSGLTVSLELALKGYKVVIYEATDRLGGSIWDIPDGKLPQKIITDDLSIFTKLPVEIHYSTIVDNRGSAINFDSLCEKYDAVYLGVGGKAVMSLDTGLELDHHWRVVVDPLTLGTSHPKVFAGGSVLRGNEVRSAIQSISDGKIAAISMDRLLQNASLTANRAKEGPYETSLYTNIEGIKPQAATPMSVPNEGYSEEEASEEAKRCLLCECRECVKACEYLAQYKAYPKRYVREVYNNLSIVMGIHHANKMINSCSLCGLCEQICPGNLNMGNVCHEARQEMVKKGKMPPSAHDFALRDMAFSNSNHFVLNRHQPGFTSSKIAFFPSCQLAASKPLYVQKIYEFLCSKLDGGVGLMLGCCGAPADWAGQEELFEQTMQKIKQDWHTLGSPKIVTACPSCFIRFKEHFPTGSAEMLWTMLDEIGLPDHDKTMTPQKLAIHDSCTTRQDVGLQESVRNILKKLGHDIEELPHNHDHTTCCGYGGLMIYVNREVAYRVINRRIRESETDYLTYCAMCHDNFASQGKRTYHLLDLIFGTDEENLAEREVPGYSERQENRARLKLSLLRDIWGETVKEPEADVKVVIPKHVRDVMEDRMILVDDVIQVIAHAERTGNKLKNADNGHYIAYFRPASVTYWVEYSLQDHHFLVHNAYYHRLEIS